METNQTRTYDMKLSACMIVKNEERDLPRCLESIVGEVDQVVIVDTGSEDQTETIIGEYLNLYGPDKIRAGTYEWRGDFSGARNYSMDLADHDRILIIDADEWVVDGSWEDIRKAIEQPDFICGTIQVINTTKQGPVRGESVIQPRIFRNEKEDGSREKLRYTNKVHNQIDEAVHSYAKDFIEHYGHTGIVVGIEAKMMHTGYDLTAEEVLEKYTPRLQILRDEISRAKSEQNQRDVTYYEYQLALMFHMVYNTEDAITIWETLDFSQLNEFNRWYAHYIAARAYLKTDNLEKATLQCNGMFEAMAPVSGRVAIPEEPATFIVSGLVCCDHALDTDDEGLYKQGVTLLIEGYLKNIKPVYGVRCIMDGAHIKNDIVHYLEHINKGAATMLSLEDDPGAVYRILRQVQNDLAEFDESLLELVAT